MNDSVWPVLLAGFLTVATAWCLGKPLLRVMKLRLFRIEEDLLAFLTGSAILSALMFALCWFHLARKGVLVIVFFVSAGLLYVKGWLSPTRERWPRVRRVWLLIFAAPFALYACLYLVNALAPSLNPGRTIYVLGNVERWWSTAGFDRTNVTAFANAPQGLEMIFLFAFPFGKHSGAILANFAYLLTLPLLMVCYGRRFGMLTACVFGALLVFLSPAAGILGTTASHEIAAACTLFGSFYWLELWRANEDDRLLGPAGLLAGFSCAISYLGALGLIAATLYTTAILLVRRKPMARSLVPMLLAAGIMVVPWLAKNWLWAGNPASPFWNGWFESGMMHVSSENWYAEVLGLGSQTSWKALPMLWSLQGSAMESVFGPWLLLTPLGLLAIRHRRGWHWLAPAIFFGFLAIVLGASSLVLMFAVFAAPALGLAVQDTPGAPVFLLALAALTSWPAPVIKYASEDAWVIREMPIDAALRRVSENDYLRSRFPGYAVARSIEVNVPPSANVLTMWPAPQAYTRRLLFNDRESARAELAAESIRAAIHATTPHWLSEIHFRFPPQTLRQVRVVAGRASSEPWRVFELRVYLAGQEVARQPSWRVSAHPNAVESPLAFDSSEVTVWNTWSPTQPDMALEEIFDQPVDVDDIVVLGHARSAGELRAEGLGGDGQWRRLGLTPQAGDHLTPPGLRRAAIQEVKSLGFTYLVARDDAGPGRDMVRYPSYWGLTCVEETGTVCVFRLQ